MTLAFLPNTVLISSNSSCVDACHFTLKTNLKLVKMIFSYPLLAPVPLLLAFLWVPELLAAISARSHKRKKRKVFENNEFK